jgi:hypothetical protein
MSVTGCFHLGPRANARLVSHSSSGRMRSPLPWRAKPPRIAARQAMASRMANADDTCRPDRSDPEGSRPRNRFGTMRKPWQQAPRILSAVAKLIARQITAQARLPFDPYRSISTSLVSLPANSAIKVTTAIAER